MKIKRSFLKILNIFKFISLRNIKIGYKYLIAFLISILLFVGATTVVFLQLSNAKTNVSDISEKSQLAIDLGKLALLIEEKDALVANYIIVNSLAYIDEYKEGQEELEQLLNRLEPHYKKDERSFFEHIRNNISEMDELFLNDVVEVIDEHEQLMYVRSKIRNQKSTAVSIVEHLIKLGEEEQSASVINANNSMDQSGYLLIIANVVSIIIGIIIVLIISRFIHRQLDKVVRVMREISQSNLMVSKVDYNGKDEIGQLANAANTLRDNMQIIITKVSQAASSVTHSSEGLNNSAREVKIGSEQMVTTMEELATGAERQANSAQHLSERMGHFVSSVENSQLEGESIATSTKEVLTLTSDGSKLMTQSMEQMEKIDTIVSSAVEQVRGLDQKSDEISKLVHVVKDIADQTNLLALNAAIEAARAGEHGKGFAVVADEVRKLAEGVTSSVLEITNIVNSIQTETDEVVSSLNNGYNEVKDGIEQISKTGKSFETIEGSISSMVQDILNIANRLKKIAENSNEMNELIGEIAAVSEEAAAGVEQTSASTQQTSSSMDEISGSAEALAQLAEEMNKEIAVFKVS